MTKPDPEGDDEEDESVGEETDEELRPWRLPESHNTPPTLAERHVRVFTEPVFSE